MKTLSSFLLILNPVCGFFILAAILSGYWYYTPFFVLIVILSLRFYFYMHKEEIKQYEKWLDNFEKTHDYLGSDMYSEFWKNKETGKIIEI